MLLSELGIVLIDNLLGLKVLKLAFYTWFNLFINSHFKKKQFLAIRCEMKKRVGINIVSCKVISTLLLLLHWNTNQKGANYVIKIIKPLLK